MTDLIKTAGDLVASGAGEAVVHVIGGAGGFIMKEAGKIALGVLIRPSIEDLIGRFRKGQTDGDIPPDFETTPHGAALLQEALNALLGGLDQERSEAVKKVFLGLAMNPVHDSIERIQQLEIMRIASELSTWEIVLINSLERYRKEVFSQSMASLLETTYDEKERGEIKHDATKNMPKLDDWLKDTICRGDQACRLNLRSAIDTLNRKHVLNSDRTNANDAARVFAYNRKGFYTAFGLKLVECLYTASEE